MANFKALNITEVKRVLKPKMVVIVIISSLMTYWLIVNYVPALASQDYVSIAICGLVGQIVNAMLV